MYLPNKLWSKNTSPTLSGESCLTAYHHIFTQNAGLRSRVTLETPGAGPATKNCTQDAYTASMYEMKRIEKDQLTAHILVCRYRERERERERECSRHIEEGKIQKKRQRLLLLFGRRIYSIPCRASYFALG